MLKFIKNTNLLIGLPILVFFIVYFILKFDGLYGQDAYEYLRYSKALRNFIITGENPGDYFWPLYYPIFGVILSFLIQNVSLSLLLISVLSLIISGIYLQKIILLLFKNTRYSVIFILLFFTLSPYTLKNGMLVMSDMLTLLFIILTVFNFLRYYQKNKTKYFYFIVLFGVLAFLTRYASVLILLPFIIKSSLQFIKQKKNRKHILIFILLIGLLFMPHFLIRYQNPIAFLEHQWLQDWDIKNLFKCSFITVDGTSYNKFPNIIYVFSNFFHPRYLFLGIIFIPFLFINNNNFKHKIIISLSIVLYAIFLAGIPFQNNRFLLLSFPLIILLIYPIFIKFLEIKIIKKTFLLGIVIIFGIQSILIIMAFKRTLDRNKFEISIVELLKPYQKNTLYSFDIDIALKGRDLNFDYKNLWKKRYFEIKNNDLLLFHPTKFKQQWKNKNPMLNYNYFNKNYQLQIIKELPEGWLLYKITSN